jgi:hypothetical protein
MATAFQSIEKEKINSLIFPNNDVLVDRQAILKRIAELGYAFSLGNLEYFKIKIYFEDNVSKKVVESSVTGITDQKVILDNNIMIPINRIYKTFKFFA